MYMRYKVATEMNPLIIIIIKTFGRSISIVTSVCVCVSSRSHNISVAFSISQVRGILSSAAGEATVVCLESMPILLLLLRG